MALFLATHQFNFRKSSNRSNQVSRYDSSYRIGRNEAWYINIRPQYHKMPSKELIDHIKRHSNAVTKQNLLQKTSQTIILVGSLFVSVREFYSQVIWSKFSTEVETKHHVSPCRVLSPHQFWPDPNFT